MPYPSHPDTKPPTAIIAKFCPPQAEQAALLAKIPQEWRIPSSLASSVPRNVQSLFETCGVLSAQDIEMTTTSDATDLLDKMHRGVWSAEDVTRAFCKRAAVAQQLVRKPPFPPGAESWIPSFDGLTLYFCWQLSCLMSIDFDGALAQARTLDEYLKKHGKVVGPLHGLPISIKVWGNRSSHEHIDIYII
jgi:amidase